MAKVQLGQKHGCRECGVKFYDLGRQPPTCPACGALVQGVDKPRPKRPPSAEPKKAAAVVVADDDTGVEVDDDLDIDGDDIDEDLDGDESDKDGAGSKLIEDVSELGEDDTDVAGVVGGDNDE